MMGRTAKAFPLATLLVPCLMLPLVTIASVHSQSKDIKQIGIVKFGGNIHEPSADEHPVTPAHVQYFQQLSSTLIHATHGIR